METLWTYAPTPEKKKIDRVAKDHGISRMLAELLLKNGLNADETIQNFLHPTWQQLHDPWLMHAMAEAVTALSSAIERSEKIMIYGDFDVDGTTAVSLCVNFFRALTRASILPNFPITYYIPDRKEEGYGLSKKGVAHAEELGCRLMVVLDCGIADFESLAMAHTLGIRVIVCDHHEPREREPETTIVLNPKQKKCSYPFKGLSGCGVGFKLLCAFSDKLGISTDHLNNYIELVALSTLADLVPLTGENRVIVHLGMKNLWGHTRVAGLRALLNIVHPVRETMRARDLGFTLCPSINAAGRMKHAHEAVRCLIAEPEDEVLACAEKLCELNALRREKTQEVYEEARQQLAASSPEEADCLVAHERTWEKGVLGIVASRCVEAYHTPTILLTGAGTLTGSARAPEGINLHAALTQCAPLLTRYGGHHAAAGLSMKEDQLPPFKEQIAKSIRSLSEGSTKHSTPQYTIARVLPLSMIGKPLYDEVERLSPFGRGNGQPLFLSTAVVVKAPAQLLKGKHVKFRVADEGRGEISCIFFNGGRHYKRLIKPDQPFHMLYTLERDSYQGKKKIVLHVKDIKWD